jgi:two-component system, OmpR family, alkaline phosphatase synthesis response regulator PhoP
MKVLAVENSPELLKLICGLLEKEGFDTLTATGGREALDKFAHDKPDIVCLDIGLDDISGYDVCREMRKADAELPILLVTSKSRTLDIGEGMEAGATEYIIKPFDLASFTALLRELACACIARRHPDTLDDYFDFGPIRVFPARLSAERRGKTADLTLREIRILKVLYDNKGRTVPAAELEAHCGRSGAAEATAVKWHIGQLRKKIESSLAAPELIQSEGTGYRFG